MSNTVAIRRAFLEAADNLIKRRADSMNIVMCINAFEAAINTMMDEPMRLLLVTEDEARAIKEKAGIDP